MTAAPSSPTTVLIMGANRGRALATRFLLQSNTTVIAAVRRPEHSTSQSLSELPRGKSSKLITVKSDSVLDTDAHDAIKLLQTEHGIDKLTIVIANAGHGTVYGDLSQAPYVSLKLSVRPLLEAGERPRFVLMGSPIASIGAMENSPYPTFAYGASKAAAHYLTRKVHCESPGVIAFVIDPG
ncbi:hypothetical protein F4779DRAFT_623499 [Xylariaceae sp. FL0662B]|nr:hypothetical protein F4779DRAFT_623499 [Xylariaceae sp. FL0662B]